MIVQLMQKSEGEISKESWDKLAQFKAAAESNPRRLKKIEEKDLVGRVRE